MAQIAAEVTGESSMEVGADDVRAATLCRLAEDLAASQAWNPAAVTAAVDAEISLYRGVERVLHATRVEIASAGPNLERLADVGYGASFERTDDPR